MDDKEIRSTRPEFHNWPNKKWWNRGRNRQIEGVRSLRNSRNTTWMQLQFDRNDFVRELITELSLSFTGLQIKLIMSSNKRQVSCKRPNFGYPHWNMRLPLISAAPLNAALITIVTIFYYSGTSLKRTSSKADPSLRRTKNFVQDEFLRNPL